MFFQIWVTSKQYQTSFICFKHTHTHTHTQSNAASIRIEFIRNIRRIFLLISIKLSFFQVETKIIIIILQNIQNFWTQQNANSRLNSNSFGSWKKKLLKLELKLFFSLLAKLSLLCVLFFSPIKSIKDSKRIYKEREELICICKHIYIFILAHMFVCILYNENVKLISVVVVALSR